MRGTGEAHRRPAVGLVLGAGGIVGGAYEAGALAALAEETGWDARDATLVVGTSAGAHTGAGLRLGLSPADHFAHAVGEPLSEEGMALLGGEAPGRLRLPQHLRLARPPRPLAPWMALRALVAPGPFRPGLVLGGMLPRGDHDTAPVGDRLRSVGDGSWPQAPLWLCAVRTADARRVVFGRDDVPTPDLPSAVEASCAMCSFFRPVRVGGRDHVDGGVWSPSNLDLVAGVGLDLVVVVSPMSTPPGPEEGSPLSRVLSPANWSDRWHATLLAWERRRVEQRGTKVLDLSPTAADLVGIRHASLNPELGPIAARRAHASVRDRLADLTGPRTEERQTASSDRAAYDLLLAAAQAPRSGSGNSGRETQAL